MGYCSCCSRRNAPGISLDAVVAVKKNLPNAVADAGADDGVLAIVCDEPAMAMLQANVRNQNTERANERQKVSTYIAGHT